MSRSDTLRMRAQIVGNLPGVNGGPYYDQYGNQGGGSYDTSAGSFNPEDLSSFGSGGGGDAGAGGGGDPADDSSGNVWADIGNFIVTNWDSISQFFSMGSGYDSENGGEVMHQLDLTDWLGLPWANAYMHWVETYRPSLWDSGDIWDATDYGHPSNFYWAYLPLVNAGMPEGYLVDEYMRPIGLSAAAQHVLDQEMQSNASDTIVNRPRPGGNLTANAPTRPRKDAPGYRPPVTESKALMIGGAVLLGLLLLPKLTGNR